MNYTAQQIENAKRKYHASMQYRTIADYQPEFIGYNTAAQRCEYHNQVVADIRNGNKELEREWKLFFLNEEVKSDRKIAEAKAKKAANIAACADILAPVREAKKITAFGQWLNTPKNPYRSQHFSKKYTAEAVNAFLSL